MVDHPSTIFYGSFDFVKDAITMYEYDYEGKNLIASSIFENSPKSYVEVEGFQYFQPRESHAEVAIPLQKCVDSLKFYGISETMQVSCPDKKCGIDRYRSAPVYISACLVHLNDYHKWSFKQIGQWLEGLGL